MTMSSCSRKLGGSRRGGASSPCPIFLPRQRPTVVVFSSFYCLLLLLPSIVGRQNLRTTTTIGARQPHNGHDGKHRMSQRDEKYSKHIENWVFVCVSFA